MPRRTRHGSARVAVGMIYSLSLASVYISQVIDKKGVPLVICY
jgi:hypothetical protein